MSKLYDVTGRFENREIKEHAVHKDRVLSLLLGYLGKSIHGQDIHIQCIGEDSSIVSQTEEDSANDTSENKDW